MKAITIHQPWADLIVRGIKTVENRVWNTSFRGPLAIHAGKSRAWFQGLTTAQVYGHFELEPPAPGSLAFGALIGTVELVDAVTPEEAIAFGHDPQFIDETDGNWCWVLTNPRRLARPVTCRGHQSFWPVPNQLIERELEPRPAVRR